jgi:hypothetical protein
VYVPSAPRLTVVLVAYGTVLPYEVPPFVEVAIVDNATASVKERVSVGVLLFVESWPPNVLAPATVKLPDGPAVAMTSVFGAVAVAEVLPAWSVAIAVTV